MSRAPTPKDFIPTFNYGSQYSHVVRGVQDPRPWDVGQVILELARPDATLLDVGCGDGKKIVGLAPYFDRIIAVEPSGALRSEAQQLFSDARCKNYTVAAGEWNRLPVESNAIDVMTSILAGFSIQDIIRLVKLGGSFVLETIGPLDQESIKQAFGRDELGIRGQYLDLDHKKFLSFMRTTFEPHFKEVTVQNGIWDTFYTPEELTFLLASTPIVRGFDRDKDAEALKLTFQRCLTPSGIKTSQNRVLVICRGRR